MSGRTHFGRTFGPRSEPSAWKVPLFEVRISDAEIEAIGDVYRSGWLSMGPAVAELEEAFAGYTGARHAVAVSSGTAALHLAMVASGLEPGESVVMPSLTFVATANAAAYAGVRPRFTEIAGLTEPWLAPEAAAAGLEAGARGIVNVAYGGHLGEAGALVDLAARHGVPLIEDAAHACGSWEGEQHAGTFGAAGAFSFFSNKNLGIGEGGMLLTDDERIAERARLLRSHGIGVTSWDRSRGRAEAYDVAELGFNYRMDEPRATLARLRLDRLDEENRQRSEIDAAYRRAFEPLSGLSMPAAPAGEARRSCHLFTVLLDEAVDRQAFRDSLAREGVETSLHYPPVHTFALYREEGQELPLTEAYASRSVSLPIFAGMDPWQQELVVEAVGAGLAKAA